METIKIGDRKDRKLNSLPPHYSLLLPSERNRWEINKK